MKISIITTITDPDKRQDAWQEALANYLNLADEVVVVNGGEKPKDLTIDLFENLVWIDMPWKRAWSWKELPLHLNKGLEAATGDWIIKLDIDQLIAFQDFSLLRLSLKDSNSPVAAMHKRTVLPFGKFSEKGDMHNIINAKFKDDVKFGINKNKYTDLCQPIWVEAMNEDLVPVGHGIKEVMRTGVSVWNFDYTFKTRAVAKRLFYQMSMAHKRYFGYTKFGNTPQDSFEIFIANMRGRVKRSPYQIKNLEILPVEIRQRYSKITSSEFGHSGWGLL